jgi:hypothetical protein
MTLTPDEVSRAATYRPAHVRICLPRRAPGRAAGEIVEVLGQHRKK